LDVSWIDRDQCAAGVGSDQQGREAQLLLGNHRPQPREPLGGVGMLADVAVQDAQHQHAVRHLAKLALEQPQPLEF
jgi:hypothetical protein